MAKLRFGHACNDEREAFCSVVESYWRYGLARRAAIEGSEREAITALWNCTDCLPGDVYDLVSDIAEMNRMQPPVRRTYAAAARALAAALPGP